jgi:hypothetical protein
MTKLQMLHLAAVAMCTHWIKLYFPERAVYENNAGLEADPDEFYVHCCVCAYLEGLDKSKLSSKKSCSQRLAMLIDTIGRREARQLRLGEPIPPTVKEEGKLLLEEVEGVFAASKKKSSRS